MKKKIIYGLLFAVAMVTASSSFVSCKDYEGDDYALLKEKNASLEDLLKDQQTALTQLQGLVNGLQIPDPCTCKDWTETINGLQNQINDLLNPNKEGSIADQVNDNATAISNIQTTLEGLAAAGSLTKEDSTKIINRLDDFDKFWKVYGETFNDALTNAKKAYITLISDSTKWNNAADTVAKYQKAWVETYQKVKDSSMYWSEAYDSIKARAGVWNEAVVIANQAYDFVKDSKYETIGEFEKAFDDAVEKLQGEIDELNKEIANITGTLKKQITSIEVQGAYNPVFGYGAIPVGLQSNVLAAFYGTAENDVKFPAYQKKFYVNGESWISNEEWKAMGLENVFEASAGDPLMAEEGNAGTLYVTINPSNVDFTGTNFTMRSSDNKVSKMQLTELAPSDKQLTFGYTRANSANGFYEMTATVDAADAAALAPNFDLKSVGSSIVDVLKDAKNVAIAAKDQREVTGARTLVKDLAEVAVKVYANSQDILPRLGLQANWTDEVTGAKSVTSKYEIAATAIKPLGFGTLGKAWNLKGIDYTPNHTFIKYIDGQAIDKEIYDIIMENLKMDLNLNLGINLEFDEMNVHYTPLEPGEGAIPVGVLGLYLTADQINGTYWQVADGANGYYNRYQMIVCDDNGNPVILGYDNGQPIYQTSGIYILDGGGWMQQVYGYDYYIYKALDKNSNNQIVLDLTEYTNALLKGIYDDVEHELQKFNSQVDKINDVNNLEEKAEEAINQAINDMGINIYSSLHDFLSGYINRANNLISRLNNYGNRALDYLINDPDRYVQPILLSISSDKNLTVVGRSRLSASVANAGDVIALKPTTMTLETVAPAFKKHLAISNVYNNKTGKNAVYDNDADAKGVMTVANQNIGAKEVIDGGTQEGIQALKAFQIPANASGMTLEIVYTALGYDGKIAGKKFYIRVK